MVRLDYPDKEGTTLRQTLLAVAKQRSVPPETMKGWATISPPPAALHVWNVFMDLINCRPAKYSPVPWSELQAYINVTGILLTPEDVNRARAMDREYLSCIPRD